MTLTVAIAVRHDWEILGSTVAGLRAAGYTAAELRVVHDPDDPAPAGLGMTCWINRYTGFGGAVRTALAECKTEWLAIMMGDGCDDPHTLKPMLALAEREGLDIVIASRLGRGGQLAGQSRLKSLLVQSAATLSATLGAVSDPSNNFRLYRVAALRQMHLTETSPAIALEILAQTRAMDMRIGEISTHWQEKHARPSSRYLRHVPNYTKHYFRYMLNVLRG